MQNSGDEAATEVSLAALHPLGHIGESDDIAWACDYLALRSLLLGRTSSSPCAKPRSSWDAGDLRHHLAAFRWMRIGAARSRPRTTER